VPKTISQLVSSLRSLADELAATDGRDAEEIARADREQALTVAIQVAACRKRRTLFHPDYFFGEPCWDMLIDLFIAHGQMRETSIAHLCTISQVPHGTALRYLGRLESRGDVVCTSDESGRRASVRISETAVERMVASLSDISGHGRPLRHASDEQS
jgi:hypothetical protein